MMQALQTHTTILQELSAELLRRCNTMEEGKEVCFENWHPWCTFVRRCVCMSIPFH